MLKVFERHHFVRTASETPREVSLELDLTINYEEQGVVELIQPASVA